MALYKTLENTNFTESVNQIINGENIGDSILQTVQIHCDGVGDIGVELDLGDDSFGATHTMKSGEVLEIKNVSVTRVRLVWIANSAYRLIAY